MFDIGWSELLVIAIVLIVVVGPEDLPRMLRAFGKATARARSMASEFRSQFDEALKEADLEDVRKTIADARSLNPTQHLRDAINPLRQVGDEIRANLSDAVRPESVTKPADEEQPGPLPAAGIVPAAMNGTGTDPHPVAAEVPPVAPAAKPAPKRRAVSRKTASSPAATPAAPGRSRTRAAKPQADTGAAPATPKRTSRKPKAAPAEPTAPTVSTEKAVKAKSPRASRARPATAAKPAGPVMPNGADEGDHS
ncbi:MAG: Sec-independent protein translocase protein TatB [Pararhizobium sp.]